MTDNGKKSVSDVDVDERQLVALDHQTRPVPLARSSQSEATSQTFSLEDARRKISPPSVKTTPKPKRKALIHQVPALLRSQLVIEQTRGTAFLLIPIIMIAGVATYFTLSVEPAAHNIPVAILFALVFRSFARNAGQTTKYTLNAALIFLLAMGLGQWRTMLLDTPMLGSEVSTNIKAQIRSIEQRPNGSVRYTLDVIATERPQLRYAPKRVRATTRKPVEGAALGQGLRGYVRLRPPSGPVRPHGFDFAFNNYFQGIGANGFFLGQPQAIELSDTHWSPRVQVEKARLWLANHIGDQDQSPSGAVAAALITGHKAAIPEAVNETLRVSGLAHILSISGLHMALVAGTVMFTLRLAFAFSPATASRCPTKKYAAMAGFVAILIYLFLAGASVATQRSFIMLAVMLGALLSDRSALTLRNLAIAAIIVILIAPEAVLGPSFQMSFSATLALIAAYAAWSKIRSPATNNGLQQSSKTRVLTRSLLGFFAALSATSVIAGTATGIFAAYHFQRVAVLGLVGNLLAMPIATLVTMPAAILATLLIPIGVDGYVFAIMNWSINLIIQISNFVAGISPSGTVGALSPSSLLWMIVGLIVLCTLQSTLRLLGLLAIVPALWLHQISQDPLLVISEDSRQVAIITGDGALAVNRKRPNSFILRQWQSAYKSTTLIKPGEESGFVCSGEGDCAKEVLINSIKKRILYIDNAANNQIHTEQTCSQYDIIILAYSPSENTCSNKIGATIGPLVITQQQLAQYGSAEIRQSPDNQNTLVAQFALGAAMRPWESHRKFSRPARNLAPIKRSNQ